MNLYELDDKSDVDIIHDHLRKFAFNVDRTALKKALLEMRKDLERIRKNSGEQQRKGWFFRTLLYRCDRIIDWMLAEELEREFKALRQKK